MTTIRVALANARFPSSREESIQIVLDAIDAASEGGASIVCFPECIVPGYRIGSEGAPPDQEWLDNAWSIIDAKAAERNIWVILGTERVVDGGLLITVRVTNSDGVCEGFQDKVQLDPSEENQYTPGNDRRLFKMEDVQFGVVIVMRAGDIRRQFDGRPNVEHRSFFIPMLRFLEKVSLCLQCLQTLKIPFMKKPFFVELQKTLVILQRSIVRCPMELPPHRLLLILKGASSYINPTAKKAYSSAISI